MKIEIIEVGSLKTNCYLIIKNNQCIVIDPGAEYEKIQTYLKKYELIGVVITHYHFDHIGALQELVDAYKIKVYDKTNLKEGINHIGDFTFEIIYTPGHKSDLIGLYFKEEEIMFVGDFIFKDTIGRTDLETGSMVEMMGSIDKIKNYPDNTIIYPGHGPKTSLKYEKENNYYF